MIKQLRTIVLLASVVATSAAAGADLFLFRGEFIYVIPRVVSDEMLRFSGRGDWKHFSEHTRYLDVDNDGVRDFVAVAFGAQSGYGAQLRYRLREDADGTVRLGRWYWAVVTAPDGSRVFEEFNP